MEQEQNQKRDNSFLVFVSLIFIELSRHLIKGIAEGFSYIDFPKSERAWAGVLGLNVYVKRSGPMFNVEVEPPSYDDQFK